jgi:hypothetical protein
MNFTPRFNSAGRGDSAHSNTEITYERLGVPRITGSLLQVESYHGTNHDSIPDFEIDRCGFRDRLARASKL